MLLINLVFIPLVITILIELPVSMLLFKPNTRLITAIVIVNMATNPALNFLIWILRFYMEVPVVSLVTVFMEIAVVLIEWRLLLYMINGEKYRILLLASIINICSYLSGVLIF